MKFKIFSNFTEVEGAAATSYLLIDFENMFVSSSPFLLKHHYRNKYVIYFTCSIIIFALCDVMWCDVNAAAENTYLICVVVEQ